jgi:hypothetical protein
MRDDIDDKMLSTCNLIISQSRASSARSAICLIKNLTDDDYTLHKPDV